MPTAMGMTLHLITALCRASCPQATALHSLCHRPLATALRSPRRTQAPVLRRACRPPALCLSPWAGSHVKPLGALGGRKWQQLQGILLGTEAACQKAEGGMEGIEYDTDFKKGIMLS